MNNQGIIHNKPNAPIIIYVVLHPNWTYKNAIKTGAITLPNEAPALNMPWAIARCFTGNHSPLLLTAPGQLPASPNPKSALKMVSENNPRAKACNTDATDQTRIETVKPR